jgi:hypothetical protein
MGEFVDTTLSRVPEGIEVPEPLRLLFGWVEDNGFVHRGDDGELYGTLSDGWPNGPGTNVLLRGDRSDEVERIASWFGPVRDGLPTLWPFCRTGSDGSTAALWRAPDGRTQVVHMGSGSGSLLTCVLGEDPVDFLRLIAIGYDEICWSEDWDAPPEPESGRTSVNEPFRAWVEGTFAVDVPRTGLEVVPHPADMGDKDSDDPWCRWIDEAVV